MAGLYEDGHDPRLELTPDGRIILGNLADMYALSNCDTIGTDRLAKVALHAAELELSAIDAEAAFHAWYEQLTPEEMVWLRNFAEARKRFDGDRVDDSPLASIVNASIERAATAADDLATQGMIAYLQALYLLKQRNNGSTEGASE